MVINNLNTIILYFILAILPGLIWLFFFLKRDNLPEPSLKVIQIFYLGMIAVIPTALLEGWLLNQLNLVSTNFTTVSYFLIKNILIIGLIEELLKYLVVRYFVLKKSFMDEPIDIPLYMIISALGFATAENILLFSGHQFGMITETFGLSLVRFLGATLLHVLCSGIIGVFLVWGFYRLKNSWLIIGFGFILRIVLHGLFDFFLESSIIELPQNSYSILYPLLILVVCYTLLSLALIKIRKLKSICIIKDTNQ